ncbi:MAG: DUF6522 family protein [Paracoccus sp. (in: a-proteobacteria)]|uniref:DUF6522 family protein n=1 Tax=Paracoccus sp. TaxID=267 RepID=UPI0026E03A0C|nr:DUF6522 family protein [Paracoccus sp. (in: a-proteobacteria)]MDO5614221.1 DUF6522 family protein [Paracoccus sp. (in: a-proteobacteria)]
MTPPDLPPFTVDAAIPAAAFDLTQQAFRDLMRAGQIATRCERGEGTDAGRWRLVFQYGTRVCRLTVDDSGNILGQSRFDRPAPP